MFRQIDLLGTLNLEIASTGDRFPSNSAKEQENEKDGDYVDVAMLDVKLFIQINSSEEISKNFFFTNRFREETSINESDKK